MTQLESVKNTPADDLVFPTDSHLRFNTKPSECDDGLSAFLDVRRNLFGIAYRMLRSAAEAEDIVQDVWLQWQTTNRSLVLDPPAFLMTITTRMCINVCQSARSRRETYAGPWLLEPVDTGADPCQGAERNEALKSAVRILLGKLRPAERAAYVLREAFEYSSRQIAGILQMKEKNVRQLLTRARRHIAEGRLARATSAEQRRFLVAFIDAAGNGRLAGLEGLMTSDVAIYSDGRNRGTMNRDSTFNRQGLHPEQTLIWCHKTTSYSVLTNTTASCEDFDRNEGDDHDEAEASSSVSCPHMDYFPQRESLASKSAAA